jgi:hypothetical protein
VHAVTGPFLAQLEAEHILERRNAPASSDAHDRGRR